MMNKTGFKFSKLLNVFLILFMLISLVGSNHRIIAEDDLSEEENTNEVIEETPQEEIPQEETTEEETAEEESSEEASSAAFYQTATVDDEIVITLSADAGVFPEGSTLSVEKVTNNDVDQVVDEARDEEANVVSSYTFDIKVLDVYGNEVQPSDNNKVNVTFAMAEVQDNNLDVNVYHVDNELNVDKLDVEVNENEAVVEVDGFSYYTVEFTYNNLTYVMEGDTTIKLSTILEYLKLSGEVVDAKSSNPDLFSVYQEDGIWYVKANAPFSSKESLVLTIKDVEYNVEFTYKTIEVTDDQTVTWKPVAYKTLDGTTYMLQDDQFEFEITGSTGAPMPEATTATNDKDGKIEFGEITFTSEDVGKYTYRITEKDLEDSHYIIDDSVHETVITVKKNSEDKIVLLGNNNILKNTNNPEPPRSGRWARGGWSFSARPATNGEGRIYPINDSPVPGVDTAFYIKNESSELSAGWYQLLVPLVKGNIYKASFWYRKAADSQGNPSVFISMSDADENLVQQGWNIRSQTVTSSSTTWNSSDIEFEYKGETGTVIFGLTVFGPGAIEAVDIRLEGIENYGSWTFDNESVPTEVTIKNLDDFGNRVADTVLIIENLHSLEKHKNWVTTDSSDYTVSLPDGEYEVREMSAAYGYYAHGPVKFTVRGGKVYVDGQEATDKTVIFYNHMKPRYKFAKVDKSTGDFLKDAWMIINSEGMPVISFNSVDGYFETILDNGTYEYAEKIAPTGYKLASPISFTVENGVITEGGSYHYVDQEGNGISKEKYDSLSDKEKRKYTEYYVILMEDDLAVGDLKITKRDADNKSKLLPNAKYILWGTDLDGNEISMKVTTDKNGEILVRDLPLGKYKLKELEAPAGYELDENIYDIVINSKDSPHDDSSSTCTNEEACQIYIDKDDYYYYDYDDGYSDEKSYYEEKFDGKLYVGGNARSAIQDDHYQLDNDIDDFTRILPYGNVFINEHKISFDNALIMIPDDSPFFLLKLGDHETGVHGEQLSEATYQNLDKAGSIVYLGYATSYIKGVGAPGAYGSTDETGKSTFGMLTQSGFDALTKGGDTETTEALHNDESTINYGNTKVHYKDGQNIITNDVDGYLYQVKYYDAVVLSDGTIGDLIFTVKEVAMEAAADKLENVPYVIQRTANDLSSIVQVTFNDAATANDSLRFPLFVYGPNGTYSTGSDNDTRARNAIGSSITWSVSAVDKKGNPMNGSISYANKDLDLASAESVWGRVPGTEYAEGLEIVEGSKSFAVVPKYDHFIDEPGATARTDGYTFGHETPLNMEDRNPTGEFADGLRFSSHTHIKYRDENGDKILGNYSSALDKVETYDAYHAALDNNRRYEQRRADDETFDSGFAVLIDATNTTFRWTGSSTPRDLKNVNTQLFDSSVYVRLQQSHGTGGDLYIEGFDYLDDCKMNPIRRDVTLGIGDSTTLVIEPQKDWEIEKITIDGQTVMFKDLVFDDEGKATYEFAGVTYTFQKDEENTKKVRVTFNDIRENHSISTDYIPFVKKDVTDKPIKPPYIIPKTGV